MASVVSVTSGSTRTRTESSGEGQALAAMAATQYTPSAAVVALAMVGFWVVAVKPFGPRQA